MNYYQETYSYSDVNDRPMLGPIDDVSQDTVLSDAPDYDPDYDEEVNRLLDEVEEEILQENSNPPAEENIKVKNGCDYADPKREQYEDCYDEFPADIHHVGPVPNWYQKMLEKKIKETKIRLENLSNLVCYACASTGDHIKRIEQDHSTVFCKMDFPRHPPLNKPWTNFWKFNCTITCKEIDKPNHAHTADCESVLLEHANTGVSTLTKNISQNEYPKFVMDAVELFQDFAIETTKNVPFLDSEEAKDTVYEKPVWTEIKLRSNYKNELMIVVRGKGVTSLISKLKRYFDSGPGRTSNVISVFCINQKWSQKKSNFPPSYVTGIFKLRDKVGPISINYEPKTNVGFNSIEAIQLGKVIQDYAGLTDETTLLDIGCNFGVLSLMMSHKCDRVIGLNTMHFVNSEIHQAEELKKFNNIHNVSFVGCDPKDVLTKCSTIIKRCITVAVLNLASPYGKSVHVMQALRDLPTIWRVILYGSFTKEFHRNISMLTSKDDMMGDNYLPMQYCILDKSPSVESAFDIVILFERKSLITPKIELLAPGPTLNAKLDSEIYDYGSLESAQDVKPIIKMEKGFGGKPDFRSKKYSGGKPFIKYRGQMNKFGKFDSPMLPMDKEQKPENSKEKSKERSPPPPATERKFDCSVLRQKAPPVPPANEGKEESSYHLSIRKELQVKELKRVFDSPSLSMPKEERLATTNRDGSLSPSAKGKSFDCSVLRKEKQFDCSMLRREKQFDCSVLRNQDNFPQPSKDKQPFLPYPSVSVKKEFRFSWPISLQTRFPGPPPPPPPPPLPASPPPPPPPPSEYSIFDTSQIKKEKDAGCRPLTTVKAEPMQLYEDKEEGELSPEDDSRSPRAVSIKSETVDQSYFVEFSEVNCQNKALPVTVKSEPAYPYGIPSLSTSFKDEPEDMQISPNPQDIENMETPIHNPRALSDSAQSSPLAASTNFTTLEGYEFSVKANQSFLPFKCDPDAPLEQPNGVVSVKTETGQNERQSDTDEEIKIIDEKRTSAHLNKQQKDSEARIRVKSLDEIIKVKSEVEQSDDLRNLIEQRKQIQRRLDREKEIRYYKELHGRSPTPDLPRRYRRQLSSSPPPFEKYKRSPSPRRSDCSPAPKKYNRSSSPRRFGRSPTPAKKYNRSPSPRRFDRSPTPKKYNRSSSPRRFGRSPTPIKRYNRSPSPRRPSSRRYNKSPPSPTRTWLKRERSPSLKRFRISPSPNGRRHRKSPPSPIRFKRESYSPIRFKREPLSPVSNRWGESSQRSPSSSSSHQSVSKWEIYSRSKSPVKSHHDTHKKRFRSRSPAKVKHKRRSLSPITLSPSSPPYKRDDSEERESFRKKKKKKSKSKSQSKSPSRTSKKINKTIKHEPHWDIPVLSTLPSTANESNVETITKSLPIEKKVTVKRERSSSPRSRTPIPGVEDVDETTTQ